MDYNLSGNSVQIKELNETIRQVAPTNISVLITGESGTGKELVANAIHHFSKRDEKPMLKVNCGAIPEGIIESELFGHQKGAFTGAIENREGYFEMADNGTIFLDEIGEMPLATQVKILRVLESGEFMRVGGNKTISTDVRIIAATNRDLSKEVQSKNFREDLYYRLRSINLNIPPLRERKSDVKILFDSFISSFCSENNITFRGIDEEAMNYLINYVWNGNARELKNFCESIIVLYPDKRLSLDDVKKHLKPMEGQSSQLPALAIRHREQTEIDFVIRALVELKADIMDLKNMIDLQQINRNFDYGNKNDFLIPEDRISKMTADDIEKEILVYLLDIHKWNINEVAQRLGQTTRTVYKKIQKFGIYRISRTL